jgi:hypothetical protein
MNFKKRNIQMKRISCLLILLFLMGCPKSDKASEPTKDLSIGQFRTFIFSMGYGMTIISPSPIITGEFDAYEFASTEDQLHHFFFENKKIPDYTIFAYTLTDQSIVEIVEIRLTQWNRDWTDFDEDNRSFMWQVSGWLLGLGSRNAQAITDRIDTRQYHNFNYATENWRIGDVALVGAGLRPSISFSGIKDLVFRFRLGVGVRESTINTIMNP